MDKNYKQYLPKINFTLEVLLEGLRRTNLRIDNISGDGGGSQDLQSVLDEGNFATFGAGNFINLMSGNFPNRYFSVAVSNDFNRNSGININNSGVALINSYSPTGSCIINLDEGRIGISQTDGTSNQITSLNFSNSATNNTYLLLPAKNLDGVYTLATLDDILNIDLDSRVYADNAAAITGGLVVKDLYRTATGELRIVV